MYKMEEGMEKLISISEARRQLPRLVKEIQKSRFASYHLLVHGKVAAEIRFPSVRRPSAGKALLALRRKAMKTLKGKKIPSDVSKRIDHYLYEGERTAS